MEKSNGRNENKKNHGKRCSCLYIKKLEDVNVKVLKELISSSIKYMKEKYN
jgi:hypothetical protein